MIQLTQSHKTQIDNIVICTKWGETVEFGDISQLIWGHRNGGAAVGGYIAAQRNRQNYPWWRVVNRDGHPVADDYAIVCLRKERHQLRNGIIVGYAKK